MADNIFRSAMAEAKDTVTSVVKTVRQTLGAVKPKPETLSPNEQLARYLRLSKDDMGVLRKRYGDDGLARYVQAMEKLNQEIG